MRKLIKSILSEVGVEDLKIRPRGENRCESANRVTIPECRCAVIISISRTSDTKQLLALLKELYRSLHKYRSLSIS